MPSAPLRSDPKSADPPPSPGRRLSNQDELAPTGLPRQLRQEKSSRPEFAPPTNPDIAQSAQQAVAIARASAAYTPTVPAIDPVLDLAPDLVPGSDLAPAAGQMPAAVVHPVDAQSRPAANSRISLRTTTALPARGRSISFRCFRGQVAQRFCSSIYWAPS